MSTFHIEFITPLFSKGAYEDRPEVRAASIRGQLHWWFRALGGSHTTEKAVFGGVHGGATASKVVVRVSEGPDPKNGREIATLPHKSGGQASPKWAFPAGTTFNLHVLQRFGGLTGDIASQFDRALESWLLLGTLGLRSTRASGSFNWKSVDDSKWKPPADFDGFHRRASELLRGSAVRYDLLREVYASGEQARRVVSDTLGGRDDRQGQGDLERLRYPLGKVFGGRKTSPLRFRVVGIGNQFRIAAIWDGRGAVTGNQPSDLAGIIKLLAERKPALGAQLIRSALHV